jgi:hypothetical protein
VSFLLKWALPTWQKKRWPPAALWSYGAEADATWLPKSWTSSVFFSFIKNVLLISFPENSISTPFT